MEKLKYALFTGCAAKQSTPEQLMATIAIAKKLDIELVELTEASCCGASYLQDIDGFLSLMLNARNLAYAEKKGLKMVTICNTCHLNSANAKNRLDNNAELKNRVNEKLSEVGLQYNGTSEVMDFLHAILDDIGIEKIKQKVIKPLSQFNIAAFYGCHSLKPSKLYENRKNKDNPHNPTSLDELIVACGAKNIDYKEKTKCCGYHAQLQAPKTSNILTGNAIAGATDANADMMVTSCPHCFTRMDTQAKNASKAIGREVELPVLHLQQMLGLALGCTSDELGVSKKII